MKTKLALGLLLSLSIQTLGQAQYPPIIASGSRNHIVRFAHIQTDYNAVATMNVGPYTATYTRRWHPVHGRGGMVEIRHGQTVVSRHPTNETFRFNPIQHNGRFPTAGQYPMTLVAYRATSGGIIIHSAQSAFGGPIKVRLP